MGLLCAFGWQSRAQYRHSAVDLDRLRSGKRSEKISMGTRKTSVDDLIGKATPVERHGLPKGMVRLRSTGSFHQKECFGFLRFLRLGMKSVPCPVNSVGYPRCDRRSPCQCQAGGRCRSVGAHQHQPSASRSQRLVPVPLASGPCISPRLLLWRSLHAGAQASIRARSRK